MKGWAFLAVTALLTSARAIAHASPSEPDPDRVPSSEDAALAEELFRAAKALMTEGRNVEACPKLAESYRLDPAGGTLLTLALCHETTGRTASAWADFTNAIALAKRD